tara:strand:+ start:171 stop:347 length:177 start_codon:yes stop_codon:yes gene_type:complete
LAPVEKVFQTLNLLANRRIGVLAVLGVASGLPLVLAGGLFKHAPLIIDYNTSARWLNG